MKLFHWRPASYASEAWVMAEDEAEARRILENQITQLPNVPYGELMQAERTEYYRNREIQEMLALDRYTIEVLELGEVGWSEVS